MRGSRDVLMYRAIDKATNAAGFPPKNVGMTEIKKPAKRERERVNITAYLESQEHEQAKDSEYFSQLTLYPFFPPYFYA